MNKLVNNWMTDDPVTVPGNCSLPDAYWLMIENNIRRLLIVDSGKLVGVITLEDIRRKPPTNIPGTDWIHMSEILSTMNVRHLMTKRPITVSPSATLIEAARLLIDHKISTLPVLEGNKVVGILTESDIFKAFVELATNQSKQNGGNWNE